MWAALLDNPGGFAVLVASRSHYEPGPALIQGQTVQNVVYVSLADVACETERPLHVVGHLVDHVLGCGGESEGRWLSEGGGVRPLWQEAGTRLAELFALGYGVDENARSGMRNYFAQSLAFYCRDKQRLNAADPQVTRWLRNTLWNAAFWEKE